MSQKSFEILHFSYRKWPSFHEEGCYRINLVFRVFDTDEYSFTKGRFLSECEEWKPTEIVTDLELEKKYSSGLRMINADNGKDLFEDWREYKESVEEIDPMETIPIDFVNDNGIEREEVYIKGYQENWGTMFQYIEKFDCFRFYEYFQINPVTEGIIKYIEELKEKYNDDTYYAEQLFRALKSLEIWWD